MRKKRKKALRALRIACLGIALLGTRVCAGEAAPGFVARLNPVLPCAALVAAAQANQIPLEPIDPPVDAGTVNPGDSVTALVTLCEKGTRCTQWLLYLQMVIPSRKEKSQPRGAPTVFYSSCGNKFEFASEPAFVSLRTLGPFVEPDPKRKPPKPRDEAARFALDQGFLRIGLDQAAGAIYRLVQTGTNGSTATNCSLGFGDTPFSETECRDGRIMAEALHLTSSEECALAGLIPALMSYFGIVRETKGLNDILLKIVDTPSVWSVLRHGGLQAYFAIQSEHVAPADVAIGGPSLRTPAYYFPMLLELNHHPALNITLVVTRPRPPLLACGGVTGLLAEKVGDKETYLTLRIVSARDAAIKPLPPVSP
jgi:hypothetical protein